MTGAPSKVFISYSHDTVEHHDRVLAFADRLRTDGIDAEIDQYNPAPPEGWPLWCERQIKAADVVLMVCTETFYRRVSGDEERGEGLGVIWEARIIRQLLYDAGTVSDKFVPVLFSDASPEQIPTPIKGGNWYVVDTAQGYEELYRRLTRQPSLVRPDLGAIRPLPPRRRQWTEAQSATQRQLDTPALLDDLANPDPLVCFPAAKALKGRSDLGEKLLDIHSSTRVVEEAIRTVFGSFPEQSAKILLAAVNHCGVTGETWHRASRASHYFMVDHSLYAEGAIVDLVRRTGNIEVERHSLTALGNMGRLAFYSPDVDQMLRCDYGYQKCFGYALEASARNFIIARKEYSEIRQASRLLLHLIDLRENRGGPATSHWLPLGACMIQHVAVSSVRAIASEIFSAKSLTACRTCVSVIGKSACERQS